MADTDREEERGETGATHPGSPPKKDKKQWIIVGATVFAAIVGWLIYKRSSSSGAAAPATAVVTPAGGGIAGGGTSPSAGAPPTVSITYPGGGSWQGPAGTQPHTPVGGGGTSTSQTNPSTQPTPTAAAATAAAGQTFHGGGFGYPSAQKGTSISIEGTTGSAYNWLPNAQAVQTAQGQGTSLYYETTPQHFTQITTQANFKWATAKTGGTPIYVKA